MDFPLQISLMIPTLLLCKNDLVKGKKMNPTKQMINPLATTRKFTLELDICEMSHLKSLRRSIPLRVVTDLAYFSFINSPKTSKT